MPTEFELKRINRAHVEATLQGRPYSYIATRRTYDDGQWMECWKWPLGSC